MSHDPIREALVLRLYDELEPSGRERLDAHLASCAECRAFGADLETGLGRWLPASVRSGEAPGDAWLARLRAEVAVEERASGLRRARRGVRVGVGLAAAIGFAAGVLIAGLVREVPHRSETARDGAGSEFVLADAPPKADAGGRLARLSLYPIR